VFYLHLTWVDVRGCQVHPCPYRRAKRVRKIIIILRIFMSRAKFSNIIIIKPFSYLHVIHNVSRPWLQASVVDKKRTTDRDSLTLCRHFEAKCDLSRNAMNDFIETLHFVTITLVIYGCNGKPNRVLTCVVLGYGPWYCMGKVCCMDITFALLHCASGCDVSGGTPCIW
jgi:hypothetical protein